MKNLADFKTELKLVMKPPTIKHFSKGSKHGNKLITRLRVGRSDLNLHRFTIGLIDTPKCLCRAKEESTMHYLIDCFLYNTERQTLAEYFIPKLTNLSIFYMVLKMMTPTSPFFLFFEPCVLSLCIVYLFCYLLFCFLVAKQLYIQ